jgi:hypothetical protein
VRWKSLSEVPARRFAGAVIAVFVKAIPAGQVHEAGESRERVSVV